MITGPDCLTQTNVFNITETYSIGAFSIESDELPIRRGPRRMKLGLDPNTLEIEIGVGGAGGPGASLKAAALAGDLDGAAFQFTRTFLGTGGGTITLFTGTVQQAEATSTAVRIIAATHTALLRSVLLPKRLIVPSCGWEFKDANCAYGGAGTTCGKSYTDCTAYSNTDNFGGFDTVPPPENYHVK